MDKPQTTGQYDDLCVWAAEVLKVSYPHLPTWAEHVELAEKVDEYIDFLDSLPVLGEVRA